MRVLESRPGRVHQKAREDEKNNCRLDPPCVAAHGFTPSSSPELDDFSAHCCLLLVFLCLVRDVELEIPALLAYERHHDEPGIGIDRSVTCPTLDVDECLEAFGPVHSSFGMIDAESLSFLDRHCTTPRISVELDRCALERALWIGALMYRSEVRMANAHGAGHKKKGRPPAAFHSSCDGASARSQLASAILQLLCAVFDPPRLLILRGVDLRSLLGRQDRTDLGLLLPANRCRTLAELFPLLLKALARSG